MKKAINETFQCSFEVRKKIIIMKIILCFVFLLCVIGYVAGDNYINAASAGQVINNYEYDKSGISHQNGKRGDEKNEVHHLHFNAAVHGNNFVFGTGAHILIGASTKSPDTQITRQRDGADVKLDRVTTEQPQGAFFPIGYLLFIILKLIAIKINLFLLLRRK